MNSYPQQTIDRFIALRAQGATFAGIAEELSVSKTTLINWSRKHHHEIHNLRALEAESMAEKCKISRQNCYEDLGSDLALLRGELKKRDLSDIPTARVIALIALLRSEAMRLSRPTRLFEELGEDTPDRPEFMNPTLSWEA